MKEDALEAFYSVSELMRTLNYFHNQAGVQTRGHISIGKFWGFIFHIEMNIKVC